RRVDRTVCAITPHLFVAYIRLFLLCTAPPAATSHSLLRAFACACVGARALTTHRQIAAVAETTVTSDFDQPLDIELHLPAQISFNLVVLGDIFTQLVDLCIGQIFNPGVRIDLGGAQHFLRTRQAD